MPESVVVQSSHAQESCAIDGDVTDKGECLAGLPSGHDLQQGEV
jgi:hypothetical protein